MEQYRKIIQSLTVFLLYIDELVVSALNWTVSRTTEERYAIILAGAICIWIFHAIIRNFGAFQRRKSQIKMADSKKTIQDRREILLKRKFTPDGYYWDSRKQKWIAPDFKLKSSDCHNKSKANSSKDNTQAEPDAH